MKKLVGLLKWVDNNLLHLLMIGFIFIIPLYPKKPFIDLEYTYISIRLEDFYIGLLWIVFAIQLFRKKIELNKKFLIPFALFWTAIFLSFLSGFYLTTTIPVKNIGFLHAARRVEYMSIFFIALSTIKSKKQVMTYLYCIIITLVLASFYGIGQKFFGFPAIQTMNPEFALGHLLYLTPEARISSTFAGHYDLAAYLVLLLPLVLAFYIVRKSSLYFLAFLFGLFALVLTASRISSIAYLVSIVAMLVYLRRWVLLAIVVILSIGLSLFSTNLTSRFLKTFQVKQIFVNEQTGQVVIPEKTSVKELPAGSFYVQLNDKKTAVLATNEALMKMKLLESIRNDASREGRVLTASEEASLMATAEAGLKPINTVVSDISFATRLQVEWPRAIAAFLKNPVLGTGPSSITEATDNDYLRSIGEFGALGTGLLAFIIWSIMRFVWTSTHKLKKEDDRLIFYGFLFGALGLLINASYIDVFEASKVAYQFWFTAALFVGWFLVRPQEK